MTSRSLFVRAAETDAVAQKCLGSEISPQNSLGPNHGFTDYCFFAIGGDFEFAVDVSLFRINWEGLEEKLLRFSTEGLIIAAPGEDSELGDRVLC